MVPKNYDYPKNFIVNFMQFMEKNPKVEMHTLNILLDGKKCFVVAELSQSGSKWKYDYFYGFIPLENDDVLYISGVLAHSENGAKWEGYQYMRMPTQAAREHYKWLHIGAMHKCNWKSETQIDRNSWEMIPSQEDSTVTA